MDLLQQDCTGLSQAIANRKISCVELAQAFLERIDKLNPTFNAIVARASAEAVLETARERDAELARGESRGFLHGIPTAIKDSSNLAGFPTTFGSVFLKNNIAATDSIMTARTKAAGAVILGKTNVPEFVLGSHTFNDLYGLTGNAYDPKVTAGGSSGGAACALALHMLPIADGSDFMGSLRNPAGWNNVLGLRPTQGLIPLGPGADVWIDQLGIEGPMARTARDVAALLNVQAGADPRVPLSRDWPDAGRALPPGTQGLRGIRIGWLGNLGGYLACEDGIIAGQEAALKRMADAGAQVESIAPNFSPEEVWHHWMVWRQALVGARIKVLLADEKMRAQVKPEARWEYDQAQVLDFSTFMQASQGRTKFFQHMLALFSKFDVLALPVAQTWPFANETRWPQSIAGRSMDTYHRWMECTLYATFAGMPALSLPVGFHASKAWPLGIQLIAAPWQEYRLLALAAAWERVAPEIAARRPVLA